MAYPGGGARGASVATFLAFMVGAVVLARRGDGATLVCLTAPLGLALVAAAFQRYPYGGEARVMQFAAPSICLLAGRGAATALGWIPAVRVRRAVLKAGLLGLIACGTVPQIISSTHPYRMLYDHQEREFARRFWVEQSRDAELACAHLDYGVDSPGRWQGRKAWYLCNQMIYSPRRAGGFSTGEKVSADHPLRCVVYEDSPESPGVQNWLEKMRANYRLRDVKTIDVGVTVGEGKPATEHWRVFEFVPQADRPIETIAGRGGGDMQCR
jgi:hypothetical protein